jgi:acetoin:2,6-dichlorophenolindophenol oxidoreductase subunit alpha
MTSASKKTLIELFTVIVRGRLFEQGAIESVMRGSIPGFIHVAIGQEAVAAGVCCALRQNDFAISNHRGHVHALAKGVEMKPLMAEIFGKRNGICKGKAGTMHLTDVRVGLLGSSAIVGGGLPIATGIALSSQLQGIEQVTVCFFGDGAADQGVFHESLNMASLWKLPIIYCCENNGWAQFTPQGMATKVTDLAKRAAAYDMPGVIVDGSDVLAVYEAAKTAADRARKGEGPTLLECKTHRWYGHFIGDAQKYRPADDIEEARKHDPLAKLEAKIIKEKILTQNEVEEIKKGAQAEVAQAIKYAEEGPLPSVNEMYNDVYFEGGN